MLLSDHQLSGRPRTIVSLVPSQTELLYDLGLEAAVAGITKFCVHPPHWRSSKTIIGGTKNIRIEVIDALQPDLIIANREENRREDIIPLSEKYPVWVTDVQDLEGALQMMRDIGTLTGTEAAASNICHAVNNTFTGLQPAAPPLRTAYLIWRDPYMTAGADTFIHAMMHQCGFINIFGDRTRYPETDPAELKALECELLLLSSEPYPFKEQHIRELATVLPYTRIILADGEMFSWYGSRLLRAPGYFQQLIGSL